ncbi:hypothetical protein FGW37_05535 [Streptomyces rectiverticillatus]|uniref:hypothetical protein n=1 Tax=Streptomyces rectiverticillatus TaxID=173860 RepID=UPI0015C302D1|nr:hypothetical protein [Streptomyces rectiverticillatus]QLE71138.1 hypothetical protein FGW37_05535 [Streptomyces rectiverticillatus]
MAQYFRYADWTTIVDPNVCAEYSVECLAEGCEAEFSIKDGEQSAETWRNAHTTRTGHRRFWQTYGHSVIVGPPPGSVVASRIAEHERAFEGQDSPVGSRQAHTAH